MLSTQITSVYLDESSQTEHIHVTSNLIEKYNILSTSQKSSSWSLAIITSLLSKGNHYPDF